MNSPLIHCPKCKANLLAGAFNLSDFVACPSCQSKLQIEVYPALFRPTETGRMGEALMTEGEASCFYHPQKKAVLPCEGCGRFICALCDCVLEKQHLCPSCLEIGRKKGKIKSLENTRIRYDNIALSLTLFPILFFYFTVITAPMALFVVIRYWKKPLGFTQTSRVRMVVAGVLATLQVMGWVTLIVALTTK